MKSTTIYTDGGCSGNPGPGAWASVIIYNANKKQISGSEKHTTNNRMELKAVISALIEVLNNPQIPDQQISIYTDSQYVKKGITQWIERWQKNGWKNFNKKPVKNQDLWKQLYAMSRNQKIDWHWVRGHADNEYNIECDNLVKKEIKRIKNT